MLPSVSSFFYGLFLLFSPRSLSSHFSDFCSVFILSRGHHQRGASIDYFPSLRLCACVYYLPSQFWWLRGKSVGSGRASRKKAILDSRRKKEKEIKKGIFKKLKLGCSKSRFLVWQRRRWTIGLSCSTIYLGVISNHDVGDYDKEDKVARAYDLAALKYWGTTTTSNFPISSCNEEIDEMKSMTRQEYVASLRRRETPHDSYYFGQSYTSVPREVVQGSRDGTGSVHLCLKERTFLVSEGIRIWVNCYCGHKKQKGEWWFACKYKGMRRKYQREL